jgi:c(7)-type cytochrome triheme protein
MRQVLGWFLAVVLITGIAIAADDPKPPLKLVFPSKSGPVEFDHAAHLEREKGHCAACHDKLWPQSAKEPLKSSDGCRTCHKAGGKSFPMQDNCKKCHTTDPAAVVGQVGNLRPIVNRPPDGRVAP